MNTNNLQSILDTIDNSKPMSKKEGYLWGLEHIRYVITELKKLEQRALDKKDPAFHNEVRISMIKAREVEDELNTKLHKLS